MFLGGTGELGMVSHPDVIVAPIILLAGKSAMLPLTPSQAPPFEPPVPRRLGRITSEHLSDRHNLAWGHRF